MIRGSKCANPLNNLGKYGYNDILFEPHHEKTGFLHIRKQRRRSAEL